MSPEEPRSVAFGHAYFGVRDRDHYAVDLAAMAAAGCSWVLLPFSQDDAHWEVTTFQGLVDAARAVGLQPVISPWGGDDFGGEGVQTSMDTLEWLARARATGAQFLHVDEPRTAHLTLGQVLDAWGDDTTVWMTVEPHRAGVVDRAAMARAAVLGTDAYAGGVDERVAATRAFGRQTGRLDLAWVQAFRIGDGNESFVGDTVRAMAGLAPRVGIWGWKGSTGRGVLCSARPWPVQEAVNAAIAAVLSSRPS